MLTHLQRTAARLVRACAHLTWHMLLAAACLVHLGLSAQDLQPVPALTARVIDPTGTLSPAQQAEISARLQALEAAKGSQLVVLLVASTAPEDIESYANRVANAWRIGRRDAGDGVLLVVATQDRRVRIEVAKSLEGAIPDLAAKRIIDESMVPRFRQADFAGGIGAAVERLAALLQGEELPPVPAGGPRGGASEGMPVDELLVLMVFALPIASAIVRAWLGRKFGAVVTGALGGTAAYLLTGAAWIALLAAIAAFVFALISSARGLQQAGRRSGGRVIDHSGGWDFGGPGAGSWGSGGGGFGSGGGGDFGGGGASGRW